MEYQNLPVPADRVQDEDNPLLALEREGMCYFDRFDSDPDRRPPDPFLTLVREGLSFEVVAPFDHTNRLLAFRDWKEIREKIDAFYRLCDQGIIRIVEGSENDEPAWAEMARNTERRIRLVPGHVYLLRAENGLYKIGKAKVLDKRVETIGIQVPFEIEFVHSISCVDYHRAEKAIHDRFSRQRVKGEWFELTPEDVAWFTSFETWEVA